MMYGGLLLIVTVKTIAPFRRGCLAERPPVSDVFPGGARASDLTAVRRMRYDVGTRRKVKPMNHTHPDTHVRPDATCEGCWDDLTPEDGQSPMAAMADATAMDSK